MIAHCNHRLSDMLTHYSHIMQGSHEARLLVLSSTSGTSPTLHVLLQNADGKERLKQRLSLRASLKD